MKTLLRLFCIATIVVLLTGCAARKQSKICAIADFGDTIKSGVYVPKSDNVLIIFDASSSMSKFYKWKGKFRRAEDILGNMALLIPDIDLKAGVRVFGPAKFSAEKGSAPFYGMTDYTSNTMMTRMNDLTGPSGDTPLAEALLRSADDLANLPGTTALILITDAKNAGKKAIQAAQSVKNSLGEQVCFYPILVGNDPDGKKVLGRIAGIGGCGFSVNGDDLTGTAGMASFVKAVFLARGVVRDSDKDGIYDPIDLCEATPPGTKVDAAGCPTFSAPLRGEAGTVDLHVAFPFDSHHILPQFYGSLEAFARFLVENPNLTVIIEGHTDKTGTKKYNKKLSLKRADAVKNYLLTLQVPSSHLSIKGYGASQPLTDNRSSRGRTKNRRVMAVITNP